jgi:hypothetical protein
MEPSDAAEAISELGEGEKRVEERFRSRAALIIAVMAMLLAITSLGGGNVAEDIIANNVQASNLWSKNARQTSYKLAADELEAEIQLRQGSVTPELRQSLEAKIQQYRETVARYESEPDKGEGKKELSEKARGFEVERDRALKQDTSFDLAEALVTIGIVLASVAIISSSRMILRLSVVLGAAAALLMLNGFFMLFTLPL